MIAKPIEDNLDVLISDIRQFARRAGYQRARLLARIAQKKDELAHLEFIVSNLPLPLEQEVDAVETLQEEGHPSTEAQVLQILTEEDGPLTALEITGFVPHHEMLWVKAALSRLEKARTI